MLHQQIWEITVLKNSLPKLYILALVRRFDVVFNYCFKFIIMEINYLKVSCQ